MTRPIDPQLREDASQMAADALDLPAESEDVPTGDGPRGPATPGHGLTPFHPGDEENLAAGFALSTIAHVAVVLVVAVYGLSLLAQPDIAPRKASPESKQIDPVKIDLTSLMALTKAPETKPGDGGRIEQPKPEPKPEPEVASVEEPPKAEEPPKVERKPRIKRKRMARKVVPARSVPAAPETIAPAVADASSKASTAAVEPAGEPAVKPLTSPQIAVTPKSVKPVNAGGSGGGETSTIDRKGMLKGYMKQLSRAVRKNYRYPRAAERAGLEGKVLVKVTLDASGRIISVKLAKSSGHEILDKAALDAARSVGSLPPAPEALGWGQRSIKIPFRFKATG